MPSSTDDNKTTLPRFTDISHLLPSDYQLHTDLTTPSLSNIANLLALDSPKELAACLAVDSPLAFKCYAGVPAPGVALNGPTALLVDCRVCLTVKGCLMSTTSDHLFPVVSASIGSCDFGGEWCLATWRMILEPGVEED
jgi:hypothetical protein